MSLINWSGIHLREADVAAPMQKEWPEKRFGEILDNERTWRKCERNHDDDDGRGGAQRWVYFEAEYQKRAAQLIDFTSFEGKDKAIFRDWVKVTYAGMKNGWNMRKASRNIYSNVRARK